jgi:hypothetical protein
LISKREEKEDSFFKSLEYRPLVVKKPPKVESLPGQIELFTDEPEETNSPEDEI